MSLEYFKSKEVCKDVYQITNAIFNDTLPTFSYLVIGSEKALLIDSMYGVGKLKDYVETITDKPIIHVATHMHGDHTGGSYDFDEMYMSPYDFENFWLRMPKDKTNAMNSALRFVLPEYKDQLDLNDMCEPKVIKLHPIFDGDLFDIGGRTIEVIEVAGHTAGEIVLLDRERRCIYSGDTCNTNTLLNLDGRTSVKEYRKNLERLSTYKDEFDTLYNGHDIQPLEIIFEGLELCDKIIAREDDHVESTGIGGTAFVAAERFEGTMDRKDGKRFNAVYRDEWIDESLPMKNIIK